MRDQQAPIIEVGCAKYLCSFCVGFGRKIRLDRSLHRYRARLSARGLRLGGRGEQSPQNQPQNPENRPEMPHCSSEYAISIIKYFKIQPTRIGVGNMAIVAITEHAEWDIGFKVVRSRLDLNLGNLKGLAGPDRLPLRGCDGLTVQAHLVACGDHDIDIISGVILRGEHEVILAKLRARNRRGHRRIADTRGVKAVDAGIALARDSDPVRPRSEEHTSELQSRPHLVCRLLLEKKK